MFEGFREVLVDTGEVTINAVVGGQGQPLLLLHGYPLSHVMWHKIAPRLADHFTVVAADLRGYGDSSKPEGALDHSNYSKRALARDQVELMRHLGFERFYMAGHDRGARGASAGARLSRSPAETCHARHFADEEDVRKHEPRICGGVLSLVLFYSA